MDYKELKSIMEDMAKDNQRDIFKAIISFETGIESEVALDTIYEKWMQNDTASLLNEEIDYLIDDLQQSSEIDVNKPEIIKEQDDLINVVGNVVGEPETLDLKNNQGDKFQVTNFTVVSKDENGEKSYHSCSAYGDKAEIPQGFNKGDFVKVFGQVRTSTDDKGKKHENIKVLSSKLLKAREQMKSSDKEKEDKPSILGAIDKLQKEEKTLPKDKKEPSKAQER